MSLKVGGLVRVFVGSRLLLLPSNLREASSFASSRKTMLDEAACRNIITVRTTFESERHLYALTPRIPES